MKSKFIILLFFYCVSVCLKAQTNISEAPKTLQFPTYDIYSKNVLSYKIINSANHTFSYDIYDNGRLMIHQPSVPGFPGNEGFKTKASAEKTAQLVITKISKGEMPPTVSLEEMKKLKAIP
jgi:hypothetical protein